MIDGIEDIENLIVFMVKLLGFGLCLVCCVVLYLIKKCSLYLILFVDVLYCVGSIVCECLNCGNIGIVDICVICNDDCCVMGEICVVEDVVDFWVMECVVVFKGCYYVLGGMLFVLDVIGFDELCIFKLIDCVIIEVVFEVILVLLVILDG